VQIAKAFGAEVTAVCSTKHIDQVRSIGADQVVDYTHEDFTLRGQQYDLIFAVNGYRPVSDYQRALTSEGITVVAGGTISQVVQSMLFGPLVSRTGGKTIGFMGLAKPNQEDLVFIGELLESGKIRPVIDKRYPMSQAPEALRYLGEGHARGKVIIIIEQNH
jgi:NADPH:quinone reductase-like Zn-dependent oxidoreductase